MDASTCARCDCGDSGLGVQGQKEVIQRIQTFEDMVSETIPRAIPIHIHVVCLP